MKIAVYPSSIAAPTVLKAAPPTPYANVQLTTLGNSSDARLPKLLALFEHGEPVTKLGLDSLLRPFGHIPVAAERIGWIVLDLSLGGWEAYKMFQVDKHAAVLKLGKVVLGAISNSISLTGNSAAQNTVNFIGATVDIIESKGGPITIGTIAKASGSDELEAAVSLLDIVNDLSDSSLKTVYEGKLVQQPVPSAPASSTALSGLKPPGNTGKAEIPFATQIGGSIVRGKFHFDADEMAWIHELIKSVAAKPIGPPAGQ
jgi:hypothetical protein